MRNIEQISNDLKTKQKLLLDANTEVQSLILESEYYNCKYYADMIVEMIQDGINDSAKYEVLLRAMVDRNRERKLCICQEV